MFSIRKPSAETLARFLTAQSELEFTYPALGATAVCEQIPAGYAVDNTRVELGIGAEVFERARRALARWEQFRLGWIEPYPGDTALRAGETVVVVARAGGLWWTNAARIVYTIDDAAEPLARFGFVYGTLPGHVERGEERFLIEWDRVTDRVWFDILAYSRPQHLLVRLAKRRACAMQKRFATQACTAMQRAARAGHNT